MAAKRPAVHGANFRTGPLESVVGPAPDRVSANFLHERRERGCPVATASAGETRRLPQAPSVSERSLAPARRRVGEFSTLPERVRACASCVPPAHPRAPPDDHPDHRPPAPRTLRKRPPRGLHADERRPGGHALHLRQGRDAGGDAGRHRPRPGALGRSSATRGGPFIEIETGDFVGAGCVAEPAPRVHAAADPTCPLELGWRLRRDRHGRGYASEAALAMGDGRSRPSGPPSCWRSARRPTPHRPA